MRERLVISSEKALFESFFPPELQARITRSFDWEVDAARSASKAFHRKLSTADALITTWDSPRFGDDLLKIAPRLRIIAHCGGEVKSRFSERLFQQLTITNAPDPMSRATAELGAAFLIYCARDVDHYRDEIGKRSNQIFAQVHTHGTAECVVDREVAMIGFGRVGRALVDLLRGFEMRWTVYDPFAERSLSKKYPVVFSDLKPLLRRAELLVLTAALTDQTRGLLDRKALALLPDRAVVINIARGGIVDLVALTAEVRRGRLRCALDVTDPTEPLAVNHPLRKLPGAILTPHIAGSGRQVRRAIAETILGDLEHFFKGTPVRNRVTTGMLARMT